MKFDVHQRVDEPNSTAIDILTGSTDLSKSRLKLAMNKGAVWLTRSGKTQRLRRVNKALKSGDEIHLYYDEAVLSKEPDEAILIADEGQYSVWFKPYGMLSQGSKWGDHCAINRWVEKTLKPQRPAFVVHRLDRAASGLMIIAHAKQSAAYFSQLFQTRDVEKRYQAIVRGHFPEYQVFDSDIEGRAAKTHARCVNYQPETYCSLLDVSIETGRKHQIRRHLSEAGHPIVGDRMYGLNDTNNSQDLCLMAYSLSFISPISKENVLYKLSEERMSTFKSRMSDK